MCTILWKFRSRKGEVQVQEWKAGYFTKVAKQV